MPDFRSEKDVIDFAMAQVSPVARVAHTHAKHTTYGAFASMQFGPGAQWATSAPGQTPAYEEIQRPDSETGQMPVWVLGIETADPVSPALVLGRLQVPMGSRSASDTVRSPTATEFFVAYDPAGSAIEGGNLTGAHDNQAMVRLMPWHLSEINNLPGP